MSPVNLPLFNNHNLYPSKPSVGIGHAQDFSVSKLNIKKDTEKARVSIDEVLHNKKPTSSISRVGNFMSSPTDSISHVGQTQELENGYNQEELDDNRYEYIRRLAVNRRKEREEVEGQKSVYDIGVKTGGGFRTRGLQSIKRRLNKLYYTAPSTFKNIDKDDRKYFADVVGEHAKKVRVGTGFGTAVKKKMKMKIEKDRQKGVISKADSDDMKKMVSDL